MPRGAADPNPESFSLVEVDMKDPLIWAVIIVVVVIVWFFSELPKTL